MELSMPPLLGQMLVVTMGILQACLFTFSLTTLIDVRFFIQLATLPGRTAGDSAACPAALRGLLPLSPSISLYFPPLSGSR